MSFFQVLIDLIKDSALIFVQTETFFFFFYENQRIERGEEQHGLQFLKSQS